MKTSDKQLESSSTPDHPQEVKPAAPNGMSERSWGYYMTEIVSVLSFLFFAIVGTGFIAQKFFSQKRELEESLLNSYSSLDAHRDGRQ